MLRLMTARGWRRWRIRYVSELGARNLPADLNVDFEDRSYSRPEILIDDTYGRHVRHVSEVWLPTAQIHMEGQPNGRVFLRHGPDGVIPVRTLLSSEGFPSPYSVDANTSEELYVDAALTYVRQVLEAELLLLESISEEGESDTDVEIQETLGELTTDALQLLHEMESLEASARVLRGGE